MSVKHTPLALALIAAGLLASPFALQAEPGYSAPPAGMEQGAPAELDETTVKQFVVAFSEVQKIQQQFSGQLEGVNSQQEAQALQQQAQEEMIGAVEEAGLTVADYNMVVAAMEQDPQLRDEILGRAQ